MDPSTFLDSVWIHRDIHAYINPQHYMFINHQFQNGLLSLDHGFAHVGTRFFNKTMWLKMTNSTNSRDMVEPADAS